MAPESLPPWPDEADPRREPVGVEPAAAPPSAVLRAAPAAPGESALWRRLRSLCDPGRLDPGISGVRALALAGLLAALVAAGYLWLSRPVAEQVPEAARPRVVTPAGPAAGAAAPAEAGAPGPGGVVTVHVAGKVRRPGVVRVPAGSRVADAVEAAGGAKPGADTSTVNLARKVVDGEQILVGVPAATGAAGAAAPGQSGPAGGAGAPGAILVDLNTATSEQLQQLPGVGPVLAQRMIDFRTQHGRFQSVEQLRQVSGIGDRRFAELRGRVRV